MNKEKEISITDVYLKFKDFIIRRWSIILITVLLGAATGFVVTKLKKDTYQSGIIISSSVLDKENIYSVLIPLVNNRDEEPSKRLKRFFNKEDVFSSVEDYYIDTASISNSIIFRFTLSDSSCINEISEIISDYYRSKSSINSKFENKIKLNKEYLKVLNKEIEKESF